MQKNSDDIITVEIYIATALNAVIIYKNIDATRTINIIHPYQLLNRIADPLIQVVLFKKVSFNT